MDAATSGAAELSAIVFALLWFLQSPFYTAGVPLTLLYDSPYAATAAFEYLKASRHLKAVPATRVLRQCVQARCSFASEHVKSHHGHPWNEAVDSICRLVSESETPLDFDVEHIMPTGMPLANLMLLPAQRLPCLSLLPWTDSPSWMKFQLPSITPDAIDL